MAKTPAKAAPEKTATPLEIVRGQLDKYEGEFEAVLPPEIKVERFKRVVLTAINGTPDLLKCDRRTLFVACVECATDGLIPDGREAALVAFKDDVVYMPMVRGMIKNCRKSGEISSLRAHVRYSGDNFSYVLGDHEEIIHEPDWDSDDRGDPKGVYAIAQLRDGTLEREYLTDRDIERIRSVSRASDSKYGPWTQWTDEMWKKSAIRRLSKRLPSATDLDRIATRDDVLYDLKTVGGTPENAPPRPERTAPAALTQSPEDPMPPVETKEPAKEPARTTKKQAPKAAAKTKAKAPEEPPPANEAGEPEPTGQESGAAASGPEPYEFTNWDGEVTQHDAQGFAVALQLAIKQSPDDGVLAGLLESNEPQMERLAVQQESELIVAIEEARDDRAAALGQPEDGSAQAEAEADPNAEAAADPAEAEQPEDVPDAAVAELRTKTLKMIADAKSIAALDKAWAPVSQELMNGPYPGSLIDELRTARLVRRNALNIEGRLK